MNAATIFEAMLTAMIGDEPEVVVVDEETGHAPNCECAECCAYWDTLMFGVEMEGQDE